MGLRIESTIYSKHFNFYEFLIFHNSRYKFKKRSVKPANLLDEFPLPPMFMKMKS